LLRSAWSLAALVAALGAAGCPRRSGQCSTSRASNCLAGEVCSFDRKAGCQVCTCRPLDGDFTQPDPDDTSRPPPIHDPSAPPLQ
jgi:hypothetical protein